MENDLVQAGAQLESLISDAKLLLLSPREVTNRLNLIAASIFARRLKVQIEQRGEKYAWGAINDQTQQVLQRGRLSAEVTFVVLGDAWPQTSDEQAILPNLTALATALWGDDMRPMGGMAWKRESVRVRLPQSVERLCQSGMADGSIAILFCDLDNFKNLNDQAGHEKGDDAIRFVNRELHDLCLRHGGLPFHPNGDEFYLILPDVGLLSMMEALYGLRQQIQKHKFEGADGRSHNIDLTFGLQIVRHEVTFEKVSQAIAEAEEATKSALTNGGVKPEAPAKKEKRRGKFSIAGVVDIQSAKIAPRDFARLGAVIVRRRSCMSRPTFDDPRLGMIEQIAATIDRFSLVDMINQIAHVQDWLGVKTTADCTIGSLLQDQPPMLVPQIAMALAIASGLLRARLSGEACPGLNLGVTYSSDGSLAAVWLDGDFVWGDSIPEGTQSDEVKIDAPDLQRESMALIGVQIGLSDHLAFESGDVLPDDLLSHVIIVDDRPNSGGGLPDFWQAALAQVCQVATRCSGRVHVFAWGKTCGASETVRRLQHPAEWSVDELAALAGISSQEVRDLQQSLQGNTHQVTRACNVIKLLYEIAPVVPLEQKNDFEEGDAEANALQRDMLSPQVLNATDGIRCKTAAQTYPTVIDILRKAATRESADDANQPLRELVAFKLVLEAPTRDMVPAYLRKQEGDMQRYAEQVLLRSDGRIRKILEENDQLDAFISELSACYQLGDAKRSTRRACLVVPHVPTNSETPSPEGLVSVWASPRIGSGQANIVDWVFLWRTVEAFIGLPYSLYGSIQLAQDLLSQNKLSSPTLKLRMGELTYLALSLHMRIDGVHRRIAKRIVDESSD